MKFGTTLVSAVLAGIAIAAPSPSKTLDKRATTMCGTWGTVATDGYTLFHNTFGADTATSGSQCTTFNSESKGVFAWSTTWTWAGGSTHVKSYSNVALQNINKALSAIKAIPSTWKWSYAGTDVVADVSYDMWLAPSVGAANEYEIMVWIGALGGAGPISHSGSPIATPTILGSSWKLYSGPNGDTTVYSFVANSNIKSFTGDMMKFFDYLISNEGISKSMVVTSLQGGTEPFVGTAATFTTSAYSLTVST